MKAIVHKKIWTTGRPRFYRDLSKGLKFIKHWMPGVSPALCPL